MPMPSSIVTTFFEAPLSNTSTLISNQDCRDSVAVFVLFAHLSYSFIKLGKQRF